MATHSSILSWRIPGTGEPGGLPSMGSHRVTHNSSDLAASSILSGEKALSHTVIGRIIFPNVYSVDNVSI